MEPLTPLAAFQGLALALAAAVAIDARREEAPWRYIFFIVAALLGLVGIFARSIGAEFPRALKAMQDLGGSPIVWFIALMAAYVIARPYWKNSLSNREGEGNLDWRPIVADIQLTSSRIEELEKEISGLAEKSETKPKSGDLLALHTEAMEMDKKVRASVGGDIEKISKAIKEIKLSIEDQKWAQLAIFHRERLLDLAKRIDELGDEVALRENLDRHFDQAEFEEWESRFLEWRSVVGQWCRFASFYVGRDPQDDIESLTENGLNENWGVKSEQFPDGGIIKYKTFRIYLRNWCHIRDTVHQKVRAQAFEGQQTNTRQHFGL